MKHDDPEVVVRYVARRLQSALASDGAVFPLSDEHLENHCFSVAAVLCKGIATAIDLEASGCMGQAIKYDVQTV